MDIRHNMIGCVEILSDFGIINHKKCAELHKRVEKEDITAYKEISELLEEVTNTVSEFAEGA